MATKRKKKKSKGLGDSQSWKQEEQREILKISNRVFNEKREVSSCGSCVRELIKQMERLYDIYKEEHDK